TRCPCQSMTTSLNIATPWKMKVLLQVYITNTWNNKELLGRLSGRPGVSDHPSKHLSQRFDGARQNRQRAKEICLHIDDTDSRRRLTTDRLPFTLSGSGVRVPQRPLRASSQRDGPQ